MAVVVLPSGEGSDDLFTLLPGILVELATTATSASNVKKIFIVLLRVTTALVGTHL